MDLLIMQTDETVMTLIDLHIKYHLIIIFFTSSQNNIFYLKEDALKMKHSMVSEHALIVDA